MSAARSLACPERDACAAALRALPRTGVALADLRACLPHLDPGRCRALYDDDRGDGAVVVVAPPLFVHNCVHVLRWCPAARWLRRACVATVAARDGRPAYHAAVAYADMVWPAWLTRPPGHLVAFRLGGALAAAATLARPYAAFAADSGRAAGLPDLDAELVDVTADPLAAAELAAAATVPVTTVTNCGGCGGVLDLAARCLDCGRAGDVGTDWTLPLPPRVHAALGAAGRDFTLTAAALGDRQRREAADRAVAAIVDECNTLLSDRVVLLRDPGLRALVRDRLPAYAAALAAPPPPEEPRLRPLGYARDFDLPLPPTP